MPHCSPDEILSAVSKRRDIINSLLSEVDNRQELASTVSVSRVTVDRALRELEELNIVDSTGSDYLLTQFGRHAFYVYEELRRDYGNLQRIQDLLMVLPSDSQINPIVLSGGETSRATLSNPQRPRQNLLSLLESASTVRMQAPVIDPKILDTLYQRTVDGEKPTKLVIGEELVDYLRFEHGVDWKAFVTSNVSTVKQRPSRPPYALLVADEGVILGFYDEHGILRGAIRNESEDAAMWAESQLDVVFAEGQDIEIHP